MYLKRAFFLIFCWTLAVQGDFLDNYCGTAPPFAVEGPQDGNLIQLLVAHRHGDRSPTQLFNGFGPVPNWMCSSHTEQGTGAGDIRRRLYNMTRWGPNPLNGDCLFGQLTSKGVEQLRAVGVGLRSAYPSFFPNVPQNKTAHVRVSNYQRTIDSAMALLGGLFPNYSGEEENSRPIEFHQREARYDPLLAPMNCDKSTAILANITQTDPRMIAFINDQLTPAVISLAQKLNLSLQDAQTVALSAIDGWGAAYCHNFSVPVDRPTLLQLATLANNFYAISNTNPAMLLIETPGLFKEYLALMESTLLTGAAPEHPFLHFSNHDTTMMSILAGFGVYPSTQWPPYAAHLRVEVWNSASRGILVRAVYNNQVVNIKCASTTGYCSGPGFVDMLRKGITPGWQDSCFNQPYPDFI
eukprot:PhF_6_TR5525/c0_g1_i1/m.7845